MSMDRSAYSADATVFAALELSKGSWLLAVHRADRSQPSLHPLKGGDVRALFSQLRASGYTTSAGTLLTANVQGGLYSLCGYYPGSTVQALIANGVLALINKTFSTSLASVSVDTIVAADPNIRVTPNARVASASEAAAVDSRLSGLSIGVHPLVPNKGAPSAGEMVRDRGTLRDNGIER